MDKPSPTKVGLKWNESQFKLTSTETEHLIQSLDPYNHDLINYSDIVRIFTSQTYTIEHMQDESTIHLTILEKFVTKTIELEEG